MKYRNYKHIQLIVFLGLIAKLMSVSSDCDVGKTVHDFDFKKVISDTLKCFLYQAVAATSVCY